jgi:acetoin utilization deacetylase AcuC-like enzyme
MPTTGLAQDHRFQYHDTGPGHPERSERLERLDSALQEAGLIERCAPINVIEVDPGLVQEVHEFDYIDRVRLSCQQGMPFIDTPDSAISPDSYRIALLAVGAVIDATNQVMTGQIDNALCLVRPPGHHAERAVSMGFCLFNNVAVAAHHLIRQFRLQRVAILDWDVHHGNGTQHAFDADPRVLYISVHGHPRAVYPGTGYETEVGVGPGEGFTLNCPMKPASDDADYHNVFQDQIIPALDKFAPEFVIVSAGFDAHKLDPLAPLELETESFGWMTEMVLDVARRHSEGRVVSVLEGGYHLDALAASTCLHLERLLEA